MSSHRKRLIADEPSRSTHGKRPHERSPSPSRLPAPAIPVVPAPASSRPSFPSHLDFPDLPTKVLRICDILSSSPSVESSLDKSGILISSDDVEEVLKLSYSHPGAAVKFFRWSGAWLKNRHSPYSWNLVVDLLGKNLLFDAMWDAVRSMHSEGLISLATFASIFSSFAAAGRPEEALAAFDALAPHGIPQDTAALNSLLSALSREGLTSAALDYLRRIRVRIAPDSDSYAIILEGFENERNHRGAHEVFNEMVLRIGWNPANVPAYDSFLNTLLSHGPNGFDEALRWLYKMKEHNCLPGMKFIRSAIDECGKVGDVRAAILLWDSLVGKNGCQPDTELYNSMISLYCQQNQLDVAHQLLDEMVFHGAFPDSKTYDLILKALIKSRKLIEIHALLVEMVKNEFVPSSSVCDSAMNLLMDSRDWDTALKVWKIMITNGIAGEEVGNSLIVYLRDYKRLPEACKYAEDMIDRGIKLQSSTLSKLKTSLQHLGKSYIYDNILSKWKKVTSDRNL